MTVVGMKISRRANAVSQLHGHISRRMWAQLWPWKVEEEIPIGHITNGVHIQSWLAAMTDANRVRVFMDTGDEDIFMLQRAQVMQSLLNAANVENELHVGQGGHNYTYWISNFEMYLKWLTKDW